MKVSQFPVGVFGHDRGGKIIRGEEDHGVPKIKKVKGGASCKEPKARDGKRNSRHEERAQQKWGEKTREREKEDEELVIASLGKKGGLGPSYSGVGLDRLCIHLMHLFLVLLFLII
jgi:hypothetical protein